WLASRTKRATERILWALVATVSVVVIVATLSRGAWLALATAALSALILGAWTRRRAAEKGASHRRGAARFPMAAVASLLVVAAVLPAVESQRRLARGEAPAHAGAIATAATLVAFVVQRLMGFTVVALGSLAAAMAGWITSVPSSGKSDRPGQPRRGRSTAPLVLAGIPVAVLFVTLVILPIRTQVHEKEALRAPEGSPERAWALERAVQDAPWDARYPNLLGTSLLTQYLREPGASRGREWLRRAAQAQRTAIATEPWNAYYRA